MTSRYHGIKISGSLQSFLTETTTCIVEQWKKSSGYRFVPECNHAKESHTCQFFRFSYHIWRTTVCTDPEILLPWQREVTASPLSIGLPFTDDRCRFNLDFVLVFQPFTATILLKTHVLKRVAAAVNI